MQSDVVRNCHEDIVLKMSDISLSRIMYYLSLAKKFVRAFEDDSDTLIELQLLYDHFSKVIDMRYALNSKIVSEIKISQKAFSISQVSSIDN